MQEMWLDIKDYEGIYQVSNLGKVKNKKTNKILKPSKEKGYLKLYLYKEGKKKTNYIHRLVAQAFLPNPNNYKEVNHIDSNPSNNNKNNLEWCDRKYNLDYMIKHQNDIKERHEKRIEILENIFYGIELGYINNINQIKDLIDENLLNEY